MFFYFRSQKAKCQGSTNRKKGGGGSSFSTVLKILRLQSKQSMMGSLASVRHASSRPTRYHAVLCKIRCPESLRVHSEGRQCSPKRRRLYSLRTFLQSEWGFPVDYLDLRLIAKAYLDNSNRIILKFAQNLPSEDWVRSFVKRNNLTTRLCQNISRKRSQVSPEIIEKYFNNLAQTIDGVPPQNIMNYDETNLSDDPVKKECLFRREVKYPERIMNTVMLTCFVYLFLMMHCVALMLIVLM